MQDIINFINPSFIIIVVTLYCLGLFLKLYPKFKAEWAIPYILFVIAIVLTCLYAVFYMHMGFSAETIVYCIIQAILCAAVAVFGNELLKQLISKRGQDIESVGGKNE